MRDIRPRGPLHIKVEAVESLLSPDRSLGRGPVLHLPVGVGHLSRIVRHPAGKEFDHRLGAAEAQAIVEALRDGGLAHHRTRHLETDALTAVVLQDVGRTLALVRVIEV